MFMTCTGNVYEAGVHTTGAILTSILLALYLSQVFDGHFQDVGFLHFAVTCSLHKTMKKIRVNKFHPGCLVFIQKHPTVRGQDCANPPQFFYVNL